MSLTCVHLLCSVSNQDEQFESWRKEFQQERLLRIVREREMMKETKKAMPVSEILSSCFLSIVCTTNERNVSTRSYQVREQQANDALERKRQAILAQTKSRHSSGNHAFPTQSARIHSDG